MADEFTPDSLSLDFEAMKDHWQKVAHILDGADGLQANIETYLPKFPSESAENYAFRRKTSKFTNIFRDVVENLAVRPFQTGVTLSEPETGPLFEFADDVDSQGNNLHQFAGEAFFNAVAFGLDWILVDYTKDVPPGATVAEERQLGARPYWVHYDVTQVRAAYSARIGGVEQFVHVRLAETYTDREEFGEVQKERIRVFERIPMGDGSWSQPVVTLWEKMKDSDGNETWVIVEGPFEMTIPVIPLVPVLLGRRKGRSWQIHPPMKDAADLQIQHFQLESALNYAKTMTAFPILTANGVQPPIGQDGQPEKISIGPHTVLYAPPNVNGGTPSWAFIEPNATSLRFLADDVGATSRELRELGRQPLTAQSGNLTAITTAVAAQKGNAAIQAWALSLQDALDNAMWLTAMWLRLEMEPKVAVDSDFDTSWTEDDGFDHVLDLRKSGEISRETALHEAKRRNILDKDYDADADLEALLAEIETLPEEDTGDEDEADDEDSGDDEEGDDTLPGGAGDEAE